jgi:tetratricopeptide (TPR) repeat protein
MWTEYGEGNYMLKEILDIAQYALAYLASEKISSKILGETKEWILNHGKKSHNNDNSYIAAVKSHKSGYEAYLAGKLDVAFVCYSDAIRYFKESAEENTFEIANTHLSASIVAQKLGKNGEALEHTHCACMLFTKTSGSKSTKPLGAEQYIFLGSVEARMKRHDEAMLHYEEAVKICQQQGEKGRTKLAEIFRLMGILEGSPKRSRMDIAFLHLNNALEIYVDESCELGQAKIFQAMGDVYRRHGKLMKEKGETEHAHELYAQAEARYREAWNKYVPADRLYGQHITMIELCRIYERLDENSKSDEWSAKIAAHRPCMSEEALNYLEQYESEN